MTEKTCATCKWCVEPGAGAQCRAPQNDKAPGIGFLDHWRWKYCIAHRTDGWLVSLFLRTCGRRGRWWQPKEAT